MVGRLTWLVDQEKESWIEDKEKREKRLRLIGFLAGNLHILSLPLPYFSRHITQNLFRVSSSDEEKSNW